MNNEKMDAHAIARLALEAAPHLGLMERAMPHISLLLRAGAVLAEWPSVEAELEWAATAPETMRAEVHRLVFGKLERRHGGTAEFWGALAHERRKATGAPAPQEVAAAPAAPAAPDPEPQKQTRAKRLSDEERERRVGVLERCQPLVVRLSKGRSNADLIEALREVGAVIGQPALSGVRTGSEPVALKNGATSRVNPDQLLAALELLEEQAEKPAQPVLVEPAAPVAQPERSRPAPSPSGRERERIIASMVAANGGKVKASEVGKRLGLNFGAALKVLHETDGLKKFSADEFRAVD